MKDFNSFTKELVETKNKLGSMETTLNQLCDFLSNVTYLCIEGEDLSYDNPFSKGYNETVDSWDVGDNSITVVLSYHDYYEDYKTHSRMEIPSEIVDLFLSEDKAVSEDIITKDVLRLCKDNKDRKECLYLEEVKASAKELGYVLVRGTYEI